MYRRTRNFNYVGIEDKEVEVGIKRRSRKNCPKQAPYGPLLSTANSQIYGVTCGAIEPSREQ
jgi:hypothetical protein